ncbi:hypothetical protein [Leptospira levettii]|uniref:Permease n=2 Tax=Leptospira levettii TaxID=2023178 RepID=A0AAW5VAD8_9LEPT|nr:hypothetical protein [Leptospira levettii]MCW7465715.1 hypothetical protein [Leptospira levettii]MCW7496553.1 hypothetical protein [Leptospira levettii]MCW7510454.1 hypothetical protein [Leptospira levettii]MCW7514206.1 hypothetical protein [Leptospira levettii]
MANPNPVETKKQIKSTNENSDSSARSTNPKNRKVKTKTNSNVSSSLPSKNGNKTVTIKQNLKAKQNNVSKEIPPNLTNLKNHKGNWKPMDLFWEESSGAVAPEYRYAKQFHLWTDSKTIHLSRKIMKNGKLQLEETKDISPVQYEKWMNRFLDMGISQFPYEEIPEEQITGISYNFVEFQFGSTKSKFYYRLEEIQQPEWVQKKEIIKFIERMKP